MKNILLIISIIFYHSAFSQVNVKELNHWQAKRFAKSALRAGDTYAAIMYLERYCELQKDDAKSKFILGNLYKNVRDYENAMLYYSQVYKLNPQKNLKALFYYAQMQKLSGSYNESIVNFEKYIKESRGKSSEKSNVKLSKKEIEGIHLNYIEANIKVQLQRYENSVNSVKSEQSPIMLNDSTFIFVANDSKNNTNFYTAKLIDNYWVKTDEFFIPKNNAFKYIGNGSFSPDKTKFYFTYCNENWQNKLICQIYMSENLNGKWTLPVKLDKNINLANYTSTQPCIGINEKNNEVLYFVSDRKGGKGNLDIWYSEFDNKYNSFKQAKNLGSKINTTENEVTPFYSNSENTLFFSSDGHVGLGGLDVYKSYGEMRKWSEAENFGATLNSSVDDIYFKIENNSGFIVSNRKDENIASTCCDDIFFFNFSKINKIVLKGFIFAQDNSNLYNSLKDNNENIFIKNKEVKLYLTEGDEEFLVSKTLTNEIGEYEIEAERNKTYKIKINSLDKVETIAFNTKINEDQDILAMEPISFTTIDDKYIRLDNIYYEFDQASLTKEAENILDTTLLKILKNNPGLKIEIASHTDSKGDENYNIELSQKRAESVVNYLSKNGIEESRLRAIGYGEASPITANNDENSMTLNRRTEFKIIGMDSNYLSYNNR